MENKTLADIAREVYTEPWPGSEPGGIHHKNLLLTDVKQSKRRLENEITI